MSGDHDEPVFKRIGGRWAYNPGNPVGRALIVGSLLFAVAMMYGLHASSRWSEGELRDAVHAAADALEGQPQRNGTIAFSGYAGIVEDAVEATGTGPEYALGLHVAEMNSETDGDGPGTAAADRFEITTDDTTTAYCLSVSPPRSRVESAAGAHQPGSGNGWQAVTAETVLSVEVAEGGC
ncbi:hypothetical protein BJP40_09805 [Streptomyces sp. CC53]|uniref:hypothetical protein n=1 Tax=unclassified Streptomyces TaxID=2593676 RepID=UPI0008DC5E69|nr:MULTISPECIES: hypothetical protein [unclassified Streptomyces]OII60551.1 hypothetical protein BJP40_09805 [Streptomyces sp. CC53]